MAHNPPGSHQANEQLIKRRDEAKEQGLAEQNVSGAAPPDVEGEGSDADLAHRHVTRSPGNIASRR